MDQAARGPGSPSPQALVAEGLQPLPGSGSFCLPRLSSPGRHQSSGSSQATHGGVQTADLSLPFVMRSFPSPGGARLGTGIPAFPSTAHFPALGSGLGLGGEDPGRFRRGPSRSEASGGKGGVDDWGAALPLPPRRPSPPSLPLPAAPGPLRPCRAQPQPGSFGRAGGPGGQRSDHVPTGRLLDLSSLLQMEASGQRTGRVPQTWVRF